MDDKRPLLHQKVSILTFSIQGSVEALQNNLSSLKKVSNRIMNQGKKLLRTAEPDKSKQDNKKSRGGKKKKGAKEKPEKSQ